MISNSSQNKQTMKHSNSYEYNINHDTQKYLSELREYEATQNFAIKAIGIFSAAMAGILYIGHYFHFL